MLLPSCETRSSLKSMILPTSTKEKDNRHKLLESCFTPQDRYPSRNKGCGCQQCPSVNDKVNCNLLGGTTKAASPLGAATCPFAATNRDKFATPKDPKLLLSCCTPRDNCHSADEGCGCQQYPPVNDLDRCDLIAGTTEVASPVGAANAGTAICPFSATKWNQYWSTDLG